MNSVKQSCSFIPNIPENSGRPILKILAASKKIIQEHECLFLQRSLFPFPELYIRFISHNRHLLSSHCVPGIYLGKLGATKTKTT